MAGHVTDVRGLLAVRGKVIGSTMNPYFQVDDPGAQPPRKALAVGSAGASRIGKSESITEELPFRPISRHMFTEAFAIQIVIDFLAGKSVEELSGEFRFPVVLLENRLRGGSPLYSIGP
jgi:hypothetical protein